MSWTSTTVRDRARALIRRSGANCHICGLPIDYKLKTPDPMSFEVDHIVPVSVNPSLEAVPSNWAASHRRCNKQKDARPFAPTIVRRSGALK